MRRIHHDYPTNHRLAGTITTAAIPAAGKAGRHRLLAHLDDGFKSIDDYDYRFNHGLIHVSKRAGSKPCLIPRRSCRLAAWN
jgi:hypothetical protein